MRRIYASVVGSLIYTILCTRSNIYCAVGIVNQYQFIPGLDHWLAHSQVFKENEKLYASLFQ